MTPAAPTTGSLTKLRVYRKEGNGNEIDYFKGKDGSKDGRGEITIESLQPPTHPLDTEDTYLIEGKSGKNPFGPVKAKYLRKQGNSYIFREQ